MGAPTATIGVRELARRTSAIIDEITRKREPALITRRGRPVAYVLPVDSDEFEDFVLARAPEFMEGMAKPSKPKPDWERLERASIARAREEYLRTTPGERVEQQIELSRELTRLAARRLNRR